MNRKSLGPVPEDSFKKAIDAPAGQAAKILREFAPTFGLSDSGDKRRTYRIRLAREETVIVTTNMRIEASSMEEAEAIAMEDHMKTELNWTCGDLDNFGQVYVDYSEPES